MFLAQLGALYESELTFPVLECFHIAGLALSIGTIALVDFRLLGAGLRQAPVEIARDVAPWTIAGLTMMIFSGCFLYLSDPDMYYLNRSFQIKIGLLFLALIFHYTIHDRALRPDSSPAAARLIACASLALWAGVIAGGIFVAFV